MAADTPSRRLNLSVQYASESGEVPDRAHFRRWARAAVDGGAAVTIRLVDTEEGQALNRDFRGRDYPTNVLSFPYSREPLAGDLALCVPVVLREAAEQGKVAAAHFAHLVVHGILHLQGFDHENETDAQIMEARERDILEKLGYPDPYANDRG